MADEIGILTEAQQLKLNGAKIETRISDEAYLRSHPEIKAMVSSFTKSVLQGRPENVSTFAGEFFTDGSLADKVAAEITLTATAQPSLDP